MEELRDKVYDWTFDLIKSGKKTEGLILMLSTWNFASFRYAMKEFPLKDFIKSLKTIESENRKLERMSLEKVDLLNVKVPVIKIYKELSAFKGVRYVGASKIMHFLYPKLFVMWDTKIRKKYECSTNPEAYYKFMGGMKDLFNDAKFRRFRKYQIKAKVTIPRALDIFNMTHFSSPKQ